MRQAWYRKYRPQSFAELIGQEHIKVTLLNQVKSGQIANAYLFAGPKGTGKTSVARILAKSANCLSADSAGEPCGSCLNCQAINSSTMVDLMEVDGASHTGVDNIRELTSKVELAPSMGRYKIYVIDEAHMLSKGAFNALLKTLEEPPTHVIFILATTEPNKIPPTIVSRCQRFDFRQLSMKDVSSWLAIVAQKEGVMMEEGVLAFLAEQGGGSMRDALGLLEQVASIGTKMSKQDLSRWLGFVDWSAVVELTQKLITTQTSEVLSQINQIYQDGYDLHRLAEMWARVMRQLLAVKVGAQITLNETETAQLQTLAEKITLPDLMWLAQSVMALPTAIKQALLPQMPFELLAVQAGHRFQNHTSDTTPPPDSGDGTSSRKPDEVVTKPVPEPSQADEMVSQEMWQSVVEEIAMTSPTVGAALMRANIEMDNGTLRLKFSLPFYKTAFEQNGYTRRLLEVLASRNVECKIECVVEKSATGGVASGLELDEVSKVFN